MGNVIWKYVEKLENIQDSISQVEHTLNIKLPEDFKFCVMENNSGYPSPKSFEVNEGMEVFSDLLTFDLTDKFNIINIYNILKERLVGKVFPFARDPFGNYICFDYRSGGDPTIVFWEHETASIDKDSAITKVCDSFSELLDMLEENEEEF